MITAVKKVLEAEKKADEILAEAQAKKERIIEKARHEALQLISDRQKKIDEEQDAFLKQREKEIDEKRQRILDQTETRLRDVERHAETHLGAATGIILKRFEEQLG